MYAYRSIYAVEQGCGSTQYWVFGASLVADATCERESSGDFGNRCIMLPSLAQYLRDLIGRAEPSRSPTATLNYAASPHASSSQYTDVYAHLQ
jgi:hypothetical protein